MEGDWSTRSTGTAPRTFGSALFSATRGFAVAWTNRLDETESIRVRRPRLLVPRAASPATVLLTVYLGVRRITGIPSRLPGFRARLYKLELNVRCNRTLNLLQHLVASSRKTLRHLNLTASANVCESAQHLTISEALDLVAESLQTFKYSTPGSQSQFATLSIDDILPAMRSVVVLSPGEFGRAFDADLSSFLLRMSTPSLRCLLLSWDYKRARAGLDWQWSDLLDALERRQARLASSTTKATLIVEIMVRGVLHDYDKTQKLAKSALATRSSHLMHGVEIRLRYWADQAFAVFPEMSCR
ncbi:hypothetical protein OIO90_002789 [Microbotryomycetes sp. JL221]|nr:hypothetical protein OIO90_002789 [Microbotryomycetes sp. JL221]